VAEGRAATSGAISAGVASGALSFWVVDGGLKIHAPQPIAARFLVDTGTNQVLLVPQQHYQNFIRSLIPSEKFDEQCGHDPRAGVVCDCGIMQDQNLKPLQIQLGDNAFKLPVSKMFMVSPASFGSDMCVLTIQPNTMTGGSVGLGSGVGGILGGLLGALLGPGAVSNRVVSNKVRKPPFSVPADGGTGRRLQASSGGADSVGGLLDELGLGQLLQPPRAGSSASAGPQGDDESVHPATGSRHAGLGSLLGDLLGDSPQSAQQGPLTDVPAEQAPPAEHARPTRTQPSMMQEEPWMIGGMFLENFVTIFDFDNKRMGMAEVDDARRLQQAASMPQGAMFV